MNESLRTTRPVSDLSIDSRASFITRTYAHLFAALVAFTLLEVFYFRSGLAQTMASAMLSTSWLLVLGGFMLVSWMANRVAASGAAPAAQYAALGAYVLADSILFVPLLYIADHYAPGAIATAAVMSFLGFTGLTGTVWILRKDFSFLGALLRWGGVVALLLIVASVLFSFQLGALFSVAMIAFAGGAILYDTSNVLHRYPEDRHVAASLALFASVSGIL